MNTRRTLSAWSLALLALVAQHRPAEAALLVDQAPLSAADAVVVGSIDQALLPAEDFSIDRAARSLSWWGTFGIDFRVQVYATGDLGTPLFEFTPSYSTLQPVAVMAIDGAERDVFRFDLELGALPAGDYTVSIGELTSDPDRVETWYWVRARAGDGRARFGVGDPGGGDFDFDLSLQVDSRDGRLPLPSTAGLLLAAGLCACTLAPRRRRPARPQARA